LRNGTTPLSLFRVPSEFLGTDTLTAPVSSVQVTTTCRRNVKTAENTLQKGKMKKKSEKK
jgi:hypothetical protein